MALTLRKLMDLRCMQGMKLIAGEGGLDRLVCSAGIADYEFARNIHMNRECFRGRQLRDLQPAFRHG